MSKSANILVCFAVPQEAKPFRRALPPSVHAVRICLTGIGPANAENEIRRQIGLARPDLVISSGFAGGLNPQFRVGTVLFDTTPDFPLLAALISRGAQPGTFHSTAKVVVTARAKNMLWHVTGLDAVEMESGIIRAICSEHGIRSATVRVISDSAEENLPLDFNQLVAGDGRVRPGALLGALLRSPQALWGLWGFQKRIQRAARDLAAVLVPVTAGGDHPG